MILHNCFLISVSLITAIGVLLWWRYFNTSIEQRRQYLDQTHDSPVGMLDFIAAFMIWLGIPTIAIGILTLIWNVTDFESISGTQTNTLMLSLAAAQLFGCVVILSLGIVRYGPLSWLFATKFTFTEQLTLAAKAFCMVVPMVWGLQALLTQLIPYEHETLDQLAENFSVATMLTTWLGAVVAAPLSEELVFRGVLQNWLQRAVVRQSEQNKLIEFTGGWSHRDETGMDETRHESLGTRRIRWWLPILISSALFALIHLGQGPAPIPLFLFAISLGFLFRYSGSLFACIVLHFMLNTFTMFWLTLQLIFDTNL